MLVMFVTVVEEKKDAAEGRKAKTRARKKNKTRRRTLLSPRPSLPLGHRRRRAAAPRSGSSTGVRRVHRSGVRPVPLPRPDFACDGLFPRFQNLFGLDAERDGDERVLAKTAQPGPGAAGGDEGGVYANAGELTERRAGRVLRGRGGGRRGKSVSCCCRRSSSSSVTTSSSSVATSSSSTSSTSSICCGGRERLLIPLQRPQAPRQQLARPFSFLLAHDLRQALEAPLLARERQRPRRRRSGRSGGENAERLENRSLALLRVRRRRRSRLLLRGLHLPLEEKREKKKERVRRAGELLGN